MYQVSTQNETQKFDSRERAIEAARALSEGSRRQVEIEGRGEYLVYVQGDLQSYKFRGR